jgi:hypothetical protein
LYALLWAPVIGLLMRFLVTFKRCGSIFRLTAYATLIAKPGLRAIVTVDRGTSRFLSCQFLIRP